MPGNSFGRMSSNAACMPHKTSHGKITRRIIIAVLALTAAAFVGTAAVRLYRFKKALPPHELTAEQQHILESALDASYPSRNAILKQLPYPVVPAQIEIAAGSAIVIDVASGSIIYEKKADRSIPPASMTKIAVMYVVMQEIERGAISYSDIVPLPKESWACNMMPHSSLMFLGKGQIVTVEELLTGLDVCSGNDAAYALAYYVCGTMEKFIERMNDEMAALGLTKTHFVEASGYSENNTTTPREMATLARVYITRFPDTLEKFHSRRSFTYPQEHNLAPEDRGKPRAQDFSNGLPEHITMGITQQNTNVLLGVLDGCDGLKTGYIDESGYNLALTATRHGTRFLSVTMNGPGRNANEGNRYRAQDGTTLMEWAFASFADCTRGEAVHRYFIPVTGGISQWVYLVPQEDFTALTVPFIAGNSPQEAASRVRVFVDFPRFIDGGTVVGSTYGSISYMLDDITLQTISLVADRTIQKANAFVSASDFIARIILARKK
ncbi:MAG: D-alanyl-D-alanine carboxypeptidase [Treponema sp.]|nr:D-alanyl-D-alanine carboxypeptidase [Treponema sp.]